MKNVGMLVLSVMVLVTLSGCSFMNTLLDGLLGGPAPETSRSLSPDREIGVLCAYYQHFRTDDFSQWWYPGRDPRDIKGPEAWRRDIWVGRAGDYPYIGMYDNVRDAEIVRWQIRLAKAAGISAFILYIFDWQAQEQETQMLLDVAAEEKFSIGFCEQNSTFGTISRSVLDGRAYPAMAQKYTGYAQIMAHYATKFGLSAAQTGAISPFSQKSRAMPGNAADRIAAMLKRWKDHPAYLRVDGEPLIFLPYNDLDLQADELNALVNAVEHNIGESLYSVALVPQVYWYFQPAYVPNTGLTEGWADSEADAFTQWAPNGMLTASQTLRQEVTTFHVSDSLKYDKDPIIPVMPGFDDDAWKPGPDPAPSVPLDQGQSWRQQLEAALNAHPRYVFIQAWNEWHEGAQIEPSTSYSDPYLYLKILAHEVGKPWQTPPLPPEASLDPLRAEYLPR